MSPRAVGRVLLIALVIGVIAGLGEASGVAPAWAVLVGVAVSVLGDPPVVPRGVTTIAGGVGALGLLQVLSAAGLAGAAAAAVTAGLLVAVAGLLRLRDDDRLPGWAVLVGGGLVLAAARVAGTAGLAEVAPALGGLVAGLLPMQVAEVVAGFRRAAGRSVAEEASARTAAGDETSAPTDTAGATAPEDVPRRGGLASMVHLLRAGERTGGDA